MQVMPLLQSVPCCWWWTLFPSRSDVTARRLPASLFILFLSNWIRQFIIWILNFSRHTDLIFINYANISKCKKNRWWDENGKWKEFILIRCIQVVTSEWVIEWWGDGSHSDGNAAIWMRLELPLLASGMCSAEEDVSPASVSLWITRQQQPLDCAFPSCVQSEAVRQPDGRDNVQH